MTGSPRYGIVDFVDQNGQQPSRLMKLSAKGRYGTRALLDLALHRGEALIPLKDIAQRQGISLPYLEHLVAPLIAGGIIKSTRGPQGGISLLKHPQDIRLSEVIQLLEGSLAPVKCVDNPKSYPRSDLCATHDVWNEVKEAIDKVLESTTLQDLVERQVRKEAIAKSEVREAARIEEAKMPLTKELQK